jgi:hypothetical protein
VPSHGGYLANFRGGGREGEASDPFSCSLVPSALSKASHSLGDTALVMQPGGLSHRDVGKQEGSGLLTQQPFLLRLKSY